MAGAVQAGALVVDMSVETAKVKAGLAENVRAVEGSAQKMAADLVAIRKGFENALDPLKNLTVKVGSLESNLAKAQSASFSLAKGLILGAAAGMSIDAIRGKVMGVIDSMAALKTTSEKTGSSVENLSKIGFFAKQAGSDIDSVAAAIGKMSKGMAGADKETKGAGLALSFLGLKAKDLAGNLKDPAAMFMEIAKKLNEYEDGAGKAAIAQSLFGKAGADMLPTLKLMGEQGDIVAKATTEQATAARQYQRDLAKLDAQKGLLFKTIAVSLLPTLSDFTSAMIDATKNTNLTNDAVKGLAENDSISDWADSAALGVARLVDVIMVIPSMLKAVSGSFSVVGADLEVMGAKAVTMNPFLVASEIAQGRSPQAELNKALEERQKKLEDANKRWGTLWNDPANKMEQSILGRIAGRKTGSENSLDAMSDLLLGKNGPKKKLNFNTAGEDGEDDRVASAAALKLSKADLDARLNLEKTANARNAAIRKESLADMAELNRQGIASDTQLYVAKYNAAIAAGTDIAAVKQAEIDILAKYNGKDAAEKRAANGKISVLEAERVEALRASSAEAVALRKQYIFDSDKPAREAQAAADAEISATYKQIEALKEQYTNYGLLPEAITAISIAKLEKRAIDLEENEGSEAEIIINQRKLASLRALGAQQKKNSGQVEGGDVAKAKELLDILTAVDAATKSAAQGMAASFGTVGAAIGGLTTALSGYAVQQQAITAQLAVSTKDAHGDPTKIAKAQAAAAQQGAQAQVKSYGDMASAAKGFFKENSTGYKVMETAEKAFRAYEMAMAVESMVKKIFFKETEVAANLALNGSKLTGEAATTAASTGLAATEASAWGITAVVKAMASLPFPLNLAAGAATLAAVVAIGAKMVGGMSGGSGGGKSAADVQKVQGTGSVFGDSSAKSDSIRRSIEQLKANSDNMLPINQGMLTALQSIEASMAGLTNLVVRTPGLTDGTNMGIQTGTIAKSNGMSIASGAQIGSMIGGYIAGPLGIAIGAIGGAIIGGLKSIWGKTTQNIVDSGLQYGGSVRGLEGGKGFAQYASIDTKKTSWLGLSKSTSNAVQTQGLNDELSKQFGLIFTGLDKSLQAASVAMGGSAAEVTKVLDNLTLESTKVSLKGLTGTALTDALNSVISKSMDEIAQAAFPQFDDFRKVGEGYAETVMRLAGDYAKLDSILASSSTTFGATGIASIAARERLIELTGGIDKLASQSNAFIQGFLTQAEQLAPVQKYVTDQLAAMGLQSLTTRDQFKNYVLGLASSGALLVSGDITTRSQEQYAALLALSEAFAKTHAATEDLTKSEQAIADERKGLQSQYDELTMTSIQLREKERAAIAVGNLALYDSIAAIKDKKSAEEAATAATQAATAAASSLISGVDGAFSVLQTVVNREKTALATANGIAIKAMQVRIDAETAALAKHKSLADSLKSSLDQMSVSGTMEDTSRASAQAQIATALAIAKVGGPLPTADALKNALSSVTKDASDKFASYDEYLTDFYKTQSDIAALGKLTDASLSVEQRTLDLLQSQKEAAQAAYEAEVGRLDGILETARSQIDVLKGIDTTGLSILQAISGLSLAMAAAKANPIASATGAISQAYQTSLGRAPDAAGLQWWQNAAAGGAPISEIVNGIATSTEAELKKLYQSTLGRAPDAAGLNFWMKAYGTSMDAAERADFIKNAAPELQAKAAGTQDEFLKLHGVRGFAVGTNYLPSDMLAQVHEGERIIPAADNRELMSRLSSPTSNNDALATEVRELRRENREMRVMMESHLYAIAKNTLTTADSLEGAANGDMPFTTKKVEATA